MPDQEDTRTPAERENVTDSMILHLLLQETFYGAELIHRHDRFVWGLASGGEGR
jgi:hypothetical protein